MHCSYSQESSLALLSTRLQSGFDGHLPKYQRIAYHFEWGTPFQPIKWYEPKTSGRWMEWSTNCAAIACQVRNCQNEVKEHSRNTNKSCRFHKNTIRLCTCPISLAYVAVLNIGNDRRYLGVRGWKMLRLQSNNKAHNNLLIILLDLLDLLNTYLQESKSKGLDCTTAKTYEPSLDRLHQVIFIFNISVSSVIR